MRRARIWTRDRARGGPRARRPGARRSPRSCPTPPTCPPAPSRSRRSPARSSALLERPGDQDWYSILGRNPDDSVNAVFVRVLQSTAQRARAAAGRALQPRAALDAHDARPAPATSRTVLVPAPAEPLPRRRQRDRAGVLGRRVRGHVRRDRPPEARPDGEQVHRRPRDAHRRAGSAEDARGRPAEVRAGRAPALRPLRRARQGGAWPRQARRARASDAAAPLAAPRARRRLRSTPCTRSPRRSRTPAGRPRPASGSPGCAPCCATTSPAPSASSRCRARAASSP